MWHCAFEVLAHNKNFLVSVKIFHKAVSLIEPYHLALDKFLRVNEPYAEFIFHYLAVFLHFVNGFCKLLKLKALSSA